MARKIKPCEFCEGDRVCVMDETVDGLQIGVDYYPENGFIGAYVVGLSNDEREVDLTFDFPMNFCPNCGRRLT